MNAVLENGHYRVEISTLGAELQRVWDKRLHAEVLYQGDWPGWRSRSPLLFPIVGRLRADSYLYQGSQYSLQKHGFAQVSEFVLLQSDDNSAQMRLTETAGTMAVYPWPFALTVGYRLTDECLTVSFEVKNTGDDTLPFSLGAHPGLNAAMGDGLIFDKAESCLAHHLDASKLLTKADIPVFNETGREISLTNDLFRQGALIFEKPCSCSVTLIRDDYKVKVRFGETPWLGLWAFPNAPYVCVEPWHGVDDTPGSVRTLAEKPGIVNLKSGDTWNWMYHISSSPMKKIRSS